MTRLVVVGGGIAGLAAAWEAAALGAEVVLVEASDRFGGKVDSPDFLGRPLDSGPDAFLARRPEAVALAREVGLGDELVAPASGQASVWARGRLRPLPPGLVLGVPTELWALLRNGLVPPLGVARAALDLVLPGRPAAGDEAVGELSRRRLGRTAHELLVDPLLSGINAGRSEHLSLRAGVPQLAAAARGRSLIAGARAQRAQAATGAGGVAGAGAGSVFLTTAGGLARLPRAVAAALAGRGADLRTGWPATGLAQGPEGWTVHGPDGATVVADAVVVATPAGPAAALLAGVVPAAARGLAAVPHASVALVALAYREAAVGHPLDGSGFLVPRAEGRLLTACSWSTSKWPGTAPEPGVVVLRASAGRAGDGRALALDDDELVARLHQEVAAALRITGPPMASRVTRWVDGFPQYAPGHLDRIAAVEAALPPGLALAGAVLRGVGVPACIGSGRRAASVALAGCSADGDRAGAVRP